MVASRESPMVASRESPKVASFASRELPRESPRVTSVASAADNSMIAYCQTGFYPKMDEESDESNETSSASFEILTDSELKSSGSSTVRFTPGVDTPLPGPFAAYPTTSNALRRDFSAT